MATIVIQAGHYPRKKGATGTAGLDADPTEQEFTIVAAKECARQIINVGHNAVVIGADVSDANYRGNAFVAIHCDGSLNKTARGASAGYRTTEGQFFAATWKRMYAEEGWVGFRPDNYTRALATYYGVTNAIQVNNRRAFIAEAGFLTNPADEKILSLPEGPKMFARALRNAVIDIFGGEVPEEELPEEDVILYMRSQTKGDRVAIDGVLHGFNESDRVALTRAIAAQGHKSLTWVMSDKQFDDMTANYERLGRVQ